ncbi:MAG: hypothetical protein QOE82_440 [Thermoanaerobaculia bacterium]|jgi:transcriptional regulator with XRE-family HTH domain|nr:hypothetical protein [Thermoanaerobaculia bacterium]
MARFVVQVGLPLCSGRNDSPRRQGVSALQVGFSERGDNVPKLTLILRIARALGVRPGELIDHIKVGR